MFQGIFWRDIGGSGGRMEYVFSHVVTKIVPEIALHGDDMAYLWEGREGGRERGRGILMYGENDSHGGVG